MAQTCGFSITPPDNVAHYYIEEIEVSLLLTDEKKLGTICTTLGLTTPLQMPASAHMLTQYFRRSGYLGEQYLSKNGQYISRAQTKLSSMTLIKSALLLS